MSTSTVPIFDPTGIARDIPYEQMKDAIAAGGKPGVLMQSPDGKTRVVPASVMPDAVKAGGKVIPFDQQIATDKPGFWNLVVEDAFSIPKGIIASLPPVQAYHAIMHGKEEYDALTQTGKTTEQISDAERQQAGHGLAYRALAPGAAQAVGVNLPAMEHSAEIGDESGVWGHTVVPAAMAAAPIAGEAAGRVVGAGVRNAQSGARALGKTASAVADSLDPDLVGIVSPRAAHVLRVADKAGKILSKVGAEPEVAAKSAPPVYRDATLNRRNIPDFAGEERESPPTPARTYRDATLDRRNVPEYAGEEPGQTSAEPIARPVAAQPKAPLAKGAEISGDYGHDATVKTSGEDLPAKYKLVEASDLRPSHNAETFAKNEKYPEGVQERAYHTSKEAQARVIEQAQNYDPRYTVNNNPDAVNGPPIVTPDGTVLGGNSRTMSTQRLYFRGQGATYKNYLRDNAQQFGLSAEAIDKMQSPVLVREVAAPADVDSARRLGSELNKSMTAALGTSEKAVSAGKSITPQTLSSVAGMLDSMGPEAGIRDLLRERGKDVMALLEKDGAITARQRPQFVDTATGGLSEEGKQFAERALLGTVVDDPKLMDKTPKSILHKVGTSLSEITSLTPRGDDFNILQPIREALTDHADIAARGSNVATYLDQSGMFGPERNPVVDAITKKLGKSSKEVRAAFRSFASDANVAEEGQGTLAGMDRPTPERAFNDAFGTKLTAEQYAKALNQLRPKQVAKIVDSVVPPSENHGANLMTKAQVDMKLRNGDVAGAEKVLDQAASKAKTSNWPPERAPYAGSTNEIRAAQPEARRSRFLEARDDAGVAQEMNWDLEKHGYRAESEARREFIARNSTGVTKGELVRQGHIPQADETLSVKLQKMLDAARALKK